MVSRMSTFGRYVSIQPGRTGTTKLLGSIFLILSLETDQGTPPSASGGPICGLGDFHSVSDYSRIIGTL